MPNIFKNYPETIWLPKDTQVVADSYQFRIGAVGPYSATMSAATLATAHGIVLTPSNYTYARDPEIEYTDFLIQTGQNGATYGGGNIIYIKFKVLYPSSKEVYVVFILFAGGVPA
jgi:hypothetical protein